MTLLKKQVKGERRSHQTPAKELETKQEQAIGFWADNDSLVWKGEGNVRCKRWIWCCHSLLKPGGDGAMAEATPGSRQWWWASSHASRHTAMLQKESWKPPRHLNEFCLSCNIAGRELRWYEGQLKGFTCSGHNGVSKHANKVNLPRVWGKSVCSHGNALAEESSTILSCPGFLFQWGYQIRLSDTSGRDCKRMWMNVLFGRGRLENTESYTSGSWFPVGLWKMQVVERGKIDSPICPSRIPGWGDFQRK